MGHHPHDTVLVFPKCIGSAYHKIAGPVPQYRFVCYTDPVHLIPSLILKIFPVDDL